MIPKLSHIGIYFLSRRIQWINNSRNRITPFFSAIFFINLLFPSFAFSQDLDPSLTHQNIKNTFPKNNEKKGKNENKKNKNKKDKKGDKKDEDSPPEIGNFALPSSQQPGPLLSFGQNIIDKKNFQAFLLVDDYTTRDGYFVDVAPNFVYAFSDTSSVFINVPFAKYKQGPDCHSSGIEDLTVQFEHAFYSKSTKQFVQTGTLVVNVNFPSGSFEKCPSTGAGSMSYFLGGTINRMYPDWYVFFSPGIYIVSSHDGNHLGNRYLYQVGFGKNICYCKDKWMFNWLLEIDGQYSEHDRYLTVLDPNSWGNLVLITPSLWLSTKRWVFQFGVGAAAIQHTFGDQLRSRYVLVLDIGYTFK